MYAQSESKLQGSWIASLIRFLLGQNRSVAVITVFVISLWVTAGAISQSALIGRLVDPMTHNDVNYLIDGIKRLMYVEINGFWAELSHLFAEPLHAPLSAYQAALGFYLFGFHDWAPYLSNIIFVLILLTTCASLLRETPNLVKMGSLVAIAGVPFTRTIISEFAPEIPLSLFTALGVLLTLRIPLLDLALSRRVLAGLCFGTGLLAKPTSFMFVPLVVCATLMVAFVRDVLVERKLLMLPMAAWHGTLQLVLSLWLPSLYLIPNFEMYREYFFRALFDHENLAAFGYLTGVKENALYYLTGFAGEYMFGDFLWVYVGIIATGIAAAAVRGDRSFVFRQIELLVMAFFLWLPPTVSLAKNSLFGAGFGFLLLFLLVVSLRSIYESMRGTRGAMAVAALGGFMFLGGTARTTLPNTPGFEWYAPGAHIIREEWPIAQDRFRDVMLGNSPNYYGRAVYMTNVGYYHLPTLWYWFLKKDPTLDWTFDGLWQESSAKGHIEYIHQRRFDFVIAAERGNGLTYGPSQIAGATAAENAVLEAMWHDPDYMPIDQFYGPTGRTITVFQRRIAYAGWRPLGGFEQRGGSFRPWSSKGTISHLKAYAPEPVHAELVIEASGMPGETVHVTVNKTDVAQFTFGVDGKSSWTQALDLVSGQNDLVLRYSTDVPVSFGRLLLVRKINRTPETH